MSTFYISEQNPTQLLTFEQVRTLLTQANPGTIFPYELSDALLNRFGYHQIQVVEAEPEDKELMSRYGKAYYDKPYKDESSGQWFTTLKYEIDKDKLEKAWISKRADRSTLLKDTDWIEVTDLVTDITKSRFKAWRQTLRDIVNVVEYPHLAVLPEMPPIEYRKTQKQVKIDGEELTNEEFDKLRYYAPKAIRELKPYHDFLMNWSETGYIRNKQYVANLFKSYTNKELGTLLK